MQIYNNHSYYHYHHSDHYISKKWFEDFKRALYMDNEESLAKLEPDFTKGVLCVHEKLVNDHSAYKTIDQELYNNLCQEFPCPTRVKLLTTELNVCPLCREEEKRIEEEKRKKYHQKVEASDFYRDVSESRKGFYHHNDYFVVSLTWGKKWLTYIDFPNEANPGNIDNSDLICPHEKFICCSEITDPDRPFSLVSPPEYRSLMSRFSCNHEIKIQIDSIWKSDSHWYLILNTVPERCTECSENMKKVLEAEAVQFVNKSLRIIEKTQYYLHNLRDTHIEASCTMTVGELKLHIYSVWDITPLEQQLTYNDKDLIEDFKTLSEYGVTPLRPIYLSKVKVMDNEIPIQIIPTQKETGFAGTVLTSQLPKDSNVVDYSKN